MVSGNFLLYQFKWYRISKLILAVDSTVFSQRNWCHSFQQNDHKYTEKDDGEFLEKLDAAKDNPLSGSALYQDDGHFSAVVFPDPVFNWENIRNSLKARGIYERFNIDKIIDLQKQIDGMCEKINTLKTVRDSLRSQYEANKQGSDEIVASARAVRNERKSLEASLKKLVIEFRKESLQLPNIIHPLTPIGSSESQIAVKSYQHENICSRKKLHWSNLVDDYYNEIIGTYYTDRLANLEYSHLNKVNHYWLNQVGHIHSNNYPVCLSDIIRGPALEATTWPSIKSAIRLRPSKGDMLLTEDPTTGTSNWLINPYVTDYLVGSASLAAFSAYLILQQTNLATSSSSRLISMGSVYNKHSENATSSSDGHQLHSDLKSPFQQSKQISIMELSRNWNRCEAGFHVLTEQLCKFWQIYQPEWSFKLTYSQAANLYPCEMLRAVVQTDMKSSSGVQASIPLASVSLLGDWISRRIMTKTIKKSKTDSDCDPYPYMVFVNAWNFYSLLESLKLIGYIQEHESPTINS